MEGKRRGASGAWEAQVGLVPRLKAEPPLMECQCQRAGPKGGDSVATIIQPRQGKAGQQCPWCSLGKAGPGETGIGTRAEKTAASKGREEAAAPWQVAEGGTSHMVV